MNWSDVQSAISNVQPHSREQVGDFSPINQWNSLTNNLSNSQPIHKSSTSRPYSYIWRQVQHAKSNDISEYCNERYGIGILDLWKGHLKSACKPSWTQHIDSTSQKANLTHADTETKPSVGSINPEEFAMTCSTVHLDIPENLCHAQNLVLNAERLPQTPHNDTIDMFLSPGSLIAKCQLKRFVYNLDNWGFGGE